MGKKAASSKPVIRQVEPNGAATVFPPKPIAPTPATLPLADSSTKEQSEKQKASIRAFIAKLPPTVKDSEELNWVYCHPRMVERAESKDRLNPIVIQLKDIKTPEHGPAPSRRAVQLLRYWTQHPQKFFEGQLDAQKKRASVEKDDNTNKDELEFLDDLKDVDRMIREATKTTRVKHKKQEQSGPVAQA